MHAFLVERKAPAAAHAEDRLGYLLRHVGVEFPAGESRHLDFEERPDVCFRLFRTLQRGSADRAAFVVEACGGDHALGRDVNSLLRAHQDGAGFGSSPLMQSSQLQSGSSFRGYRIESLIGAGGMGEVYRARDTKLDRSVALKILPESVAHDPERLARFEREAKTLAALNHPNIAIIHGFEEEQGIQALVMELIEGPTLAERIALRPIPVDEALAITKQVAEALEAAHEHGIIHRDLKPANIKVRPDGTVKILDFGLAKALEPASAEPSDARMSPAIGSAARMTAVGMLLGTAAYMSPEQATGRAADKRSDVWAFGCVLYEMLTSKRCFDGADVADTLASVLTKEPTIERRAFGASWLDQTIQKLVYS